MMRGPAAASAREQHRRFIVLMVQCIFVLLLLEGVLRKWALSGIEQPLIFIRDPFMIAAIVAYFAYRGDRLSPLATGFLLTALMLFVLALLQAASGTASLSMILGFRFYLLFVPLLFIVPETFHAADIRRLFVLCLLAAIPVGLLVIAQFHSPVSSPLNKGLDDAVAGRFTVTAGVVRPYGPFTFALGQATYAAFSLAVLLIATVARSLGPRSRMFLFAAGAMVMAMGALSGSRSYFVPAAIIAGCMLAATLLTGMRTGRYRAFLSALVLIGAFLLVFIVVFPDAFATMTQRQETASASEGTILNRMWAIVAAFGPYLDDAPLLGLGIGAGTNAGSFLATGERTFLLAESEWARHVLELGPLLGLVVIALRILLCLYLLRVALRAALAGHAPSLIMFGFCGPLILTAQITGNNLMTVLPWLASGLVLALERQHRFVAQAARAKLTMRLAPAV